MFLLCSVSVCKNRLSIEDSIQSNRRTRLGQELVERLVHTHTNLKVKQGLDLYEDGILPWDFEMTVEETQYEFLQNFWKMTVVDFDKRKTPLSDEVDRVPQCVSDSESESEKDSD